MSLLTKQAPIDPQDVPLNSLVAQEQVDLNFISRNNFNNNAYRSNFVSNNPRPFPSNNYGNGNSNSYSQTYRERDLPSYEKLIEIEKATPPWYLQLQGKLGTDTSWHVPDLSLLTTPGAQHHHCSSPSQLRMKLQLLVICRWARASSTQATLWLFQTNSFLKFLKNHKNKGLSKTSLGKTFYLLYQGTN